MTRPVSNPIASLIPALILAIASLVSTSINAEEAVVIGDWCSKPAADFLSNCDAVFRVDLATGKRTLLSAFTDADKDTTFNSTSQLELDRGGQSWANVAIAPSGEVFIYSSFRLELGPGGSKTGIYRIAPTDGSRRLISNLSEITSGPTTQFNFDHMAITPTNQIVGEPTYGKVISINPATGLRTMLSDASITSQGPAFDEFLGTGPGGQLFGLTNHGVTGGITVVQIDASTGIRTLFGSYDPNNFIVQSDAVDNSDGFSLIDPKGNFFSFSSRVGYNNDSLYQSNIYAGPPLKC